jgi:hypothetical protein
MRKNITKITDATKKMLRGAARGKARGRGKKARQNKQDWMKITY